MRFRLLGVVLGLMLAMAGEALAAAGPGGCAPPLSGEGKALALPGSLSEAQRLELGTLIFQALRKPALGERPETLIEHAPPCVVDAVAAGRDLFVISGGEAPLPVRWARSTRTSLAFYLAAAPKTAGAAALGFKSTPYLLVGTSDQVRHVVALYDGPPADETIKADLVRSLMTSDFAPLADYDSNGDAVSIFRVTDSGIGAQLFGPVPSPERMALLLRADGKYFLPGPGGDVVAGEAGLTCPMRLGKIGSRQLFVVDGSSAGLDLTCQYYNDDVVIFLFVTRMPKADADKTFAKRSAAVREVLKNPRETSPLVAVKPSSRFEYGGSWINDQSQEAGGVWIARRGEFLVEVDARWTSASSAEAREAVQRVDQLLAP